MIMIIMSQNGVAPMAGRRCLKVTLRGEKEKKYKKRTMGGVGVN
jgi:hypothetical protein